MTPSWTPGPEPTTVATPSPPLAITVAAPADPVAPLSWQFLVTLSRPSAVRLWCEAESVDQEGEDLHTRDAPVSAEQAMILRGLRAATTYRCWAEGIEPDGTPNGRSQDVLIETAPLPDDLVEPSITVAHEPVSDIGYMLYNYATRIDSSTYEDQYLVILDAGGHVRWYYPGPGGGSIDTSALGDDLVLFGGYAGEEFVPTIIGLDWGIRFQDASRDVTPTAWVGQYHHDVGLSADGSSIFALVHTVVDGTFKGFEVRQIDFDSTILWTWNAETDGIDTGGLPANDTGEWDPFHANSIFDRWEDGRLVLYLGLRNTNAVYKIDYLSKEVIWTVGIDGDFQLLEADGTPASEPYRWFFNQHDAKMVGNALLVYDNGTERRDYGAPFNYSRALQLDLDEQAMTARISFEYDEVDAGWVESSWGGIDRRPNGNFFIAMGHCWDCSSSTHKSALVEVTPDGQPYWRADFPNETDAFYRAFLIDGCDIFHNVTYCPESDPRSGRSTASARSRAADPGSG